MSLQPASPRRRVVLALGAGAIAWLPLSALTALRGSAALSAFLATFDVHVRFLLVVPFLLWVAAPRVRNSRAVIDYLDRSAMLSAGDRARFEAAVAAVRRWDSGTAARWAAIALAVAGTILTARVSATAGTPAWFAESSGAMAGLSPAGWWYAAVSEPIWLYLFMRWCLWVIGWCRFLWVLSRLDLQLVASHPDGCAGLGILSVAQAAFAFVAPALSLLLAAELADAVRAGSMPLPAAGPIVAANVLIWLTLVAGPLLLFTPLLMRTKREGLAAYGELGDVLFRDFHKKWTPARPDRQHHLLGDNDPSSLADYGYAYQVVAGMRLVPIHQTDIIFVLAVTLVPFLPLLLLKFSPSEILSRLFSMLG